MPYANRNKPSAQQLDKDRIKKLVSDLRARIAELESRCETCDHVERICQAERRAMDAEERVKHLEERLIKNGGVIQKYCDRELRYREVLETIANLRDSEESRIARITLNQ